MYEIVLQNGAITWKVSRRYSTFFELHKTVNYNNDCHEKTI